MRSTTRGLIGAAACRWTCGTATSPPWATARSFAGSSI